MARKKLTNAVILIAWESSGRICHWCREEIEPAQAVFDHYLPVALGGSDDASNIVVACRPCNSAKRDHHPRIWELRMHEGLPFCVADSIYRFEQNLPEGRGTFIVGGESETLPDGTHRVTQFPLAYGNCDWCPDCRSEFA